MTRPNELPELLLDVYRRTADEVAAVRTPRPRLRSEDEAFVLPHPTVRRALALVGPGEDRRQP